MKKRLWIYGGAVVLAVAALAGWALAPRPVEVETARAAMARFESTVEEEGKTRLRDRYVVAAPLSGTLGRIALREGDRVTAGQTVALLTPALPALLDRRTLDEQQARVGIALAGIERAQARADAAGVAVQRGAADLARSEQLARQGFIAASQLDAERLAVKAARAELAAAAQERRIAEREAALARRALQAVRGSDGQGRAFAVPAPVAGRVLRLHKVSEGAVPAGTALLEIGDTGVLEAVAEVLSTDAARIAPGQSVTIDRWGGPLLQGRVRLVEPEAFTKVSTLGVEEQRVNVVIDIGSPPALWRSLGDGYRIGVRIVTLAQQRALTVPVGAVFPIRPAAATQDRDMAVFVVREGRARLQAVDVAARNSRQAWIRSGLTAGMEVIVYPSAEVADGVRIRRRRV